MWLQDECLLALIPGCDIYTGVPSRSVPPLTPQKKKKKIRRSKLLFCIADAIRLSIFSYSIYLFTGRRLLTVGLHKVFVMQALTPS